MALHASPAALGKFEFGKHGEEPCRRPALLVGAFGEVRPEPGDRGQAQVMQQKRQTGGVDLDRVHGCTHACGAPSNAS